MPYISAEIIANAKRTDLLTYLQTHEPHNLKKISETTYYTREHDSLKISNGKWHWFSQGIGGRSALDYLIKVKGYSFLQAVEAVSGGNADYPHDFCPPKPKEERPFVLPEKNPNNDIVGKYLKGRGIDEEILNFCMDNGLLYESRVYHNAVFLGFDGSGKACYAALRGTYGSFKGEASGSDKRYSFSLAGNPHGESVHVFESAIDALSYATLLKITGKNWRNIPLLSLGGVYKDSGRETVPAALESFLKRRQKIKRIWLHLDKDEVGRSAAKGICRILVGKYEVIDSPPPCGKDVNDYLVQRLSKKKEEFTR